MDAERDYWELLSDGDPEATADFERWHGHRRNDAVGSTPATLLHQLIEVAPPERREALIDELARRRPEVIEQR